MSTSPRPCRPRRQCRRPLSVGTALLCLGLLGSACAPRTPPEAPARPSHSHATQTVVDQEAGAIVQQWAQADGMVVSGRVAFEAVEKVSLGQGEDGSHQVLAWLRDSERAIVLLATEDVLEADRMGLYMAAVIGAPYEDPRLECEDSQATP